jgi:hypothetical protein
MITEERVNEVRKLVDSFRLERGGSRPKFPPEIISSVIEIAKDLGYRRTAELLGISESAVARWTRGYKSNKKPSAAQKIGFIEIKPALPAVPPPPTSKVEASKRGGIILITSSVISAAYVATLSRELFNARPEC